ncbi:dimethylsulfonioproprionate lyase family protein [Kiloniella sp.]|uniref:dimethylsulfonioproprionate lyase family protein n=1 Tax=Kiloniella sp. TaxID=1938587 RepID=UPI003B02C42F
MSEAKKLFDEVVSFYRARLNENESSATPMLKEVIARLEGATTLTAPEPRLLGGARHWDRVIENLVRPDQLGLRDALSATAPGFHWMQNPNYNDDLMGPGYMDNYGFIELVGNKAGFYEAEGVRCGLLLLGPGLHYPAHNHAAEEIYHVLSGDQTLWRRAEEDWCTHPAGSTIHHAPWMIHETKTGDQPLLALYCWLGDGSEAKLT